MNKTELEEELLGLLIKAIDQEKVIEALKGFLEIERSVELNGPEVIECTATILAAVVKTCPSRQVAMKLFFKCFTKMLPEVGVIVQETPHVDQSPSR